MILACDEPGWITGMDLGGVRRLRLAWLAQDIPHAFAGKGDRLPLIPEHTVALGGMLNLPAGFRFGADARYVGARWRRGDEANEEEPLGAYLLVDARVGFAVRGWEIRGIIRNVLDARYATFGTFNLNQGAESRLENFLTPGQPRSFVLTVGREWR